MNNKRIEKIRKRYDYAREAGYWNDIPSDLIFEDVPFLLNEVEHLNMTIEHLKKENASLEVENEYLKMLIEQAAEELENCYGRETQLTEEMRDALKQRKKMT